MRLRSIFSAPRRFRELSGTIESLRTEISELRALKAEISELRAQMKPVTWVPPGHFYSPLVNPNDDVVQDVLACAVSTGLPDSEDFRLDLPLILSWFEKISYHYRQLPFPEERLPVRYPAGITPAANNRGWLRSLLLCLDGYK